MKKRIIAIMVFFIICITSTIIYGADANAQINSSKDAIKPGEEITFTVKLTDIVSEKGLVGFEGKISYDTDKFEVLAENNITQVGAWGVFYNPDNGKVIAEGSMIKNNSDVISIKLKVKNDNNLIGETATISINEAFTYDATGKKDFGTISSSVKIGESKSENEPTPTETTKPTTKPTSTPDGGSEGTPTPSTKPNTTGTPTATAKPNSGENKNDVPVTNIDTNTSSENSSSGSGSSGSSNKGTTSSSSLPKAGVESTVVILTSLVVLIGTVAYIKLRKYREI